MTKIRSTRYANVAATLALLFSLAGTGTAASLTIARVLPGSLTSKEIRDGSLTLRDLSPASLRTLKGKDGVVATSLKLAAYTKSTSQTLPDDSRFHAVWSLQFKAADNQVFFITGNLGDGNGNGDARTPGCPRGDNTFSERVELDGSLLWEHDSDGTTTGNEPKGLLTFAPRDHKLSYFLRGDCPGHPVNVPSQEVLMLPFTRP